MVPNFNERANDQENDRKTGGYADKYFDENETREGQEKYDLSTGKVIINDSDDESLYKMNVDEEGKLVRIKLGIENDKSLSQQQKDLLKQADELLKSIGSDEFGKDPDHKGAI